MSPELPHNSQFFIALYQMPCKGRILNRASDRVRPKMGNCATLRRSIVQQKDQLCSKSCGSQFLISNVLRGVLIGILVYLSDGINIIS